MLNTSLSTSPVPNSRHVLEELMTYYRQLWNHHQKAAMLARSKFSSTKILLDTTQSSNPEPQINPTHSLSSRSSRGHNLAHGNPQIRGQRQSLPSISPTFADRRFNSISEANKIKEKKPDERRKHMRYQQETGTIVRIDFKIDEFNYVYSEWGQIVDDSFGGCCLVIVTKREIEVEKTAQLKLTDLAPFTVRIAWKKELDENVFKIGLEYLI